MVKNTLAFVLLLGIIFPLSAAADDEDSLAKFKGGIGVHPVSNVAGTPVGLNFPDVTRNVVRTVNPAGQIWVIKDLKADVKLDGSIEVDGHGLLLAGGNNIGLNAGASVFATLICGAVAPFSLHSSAPAGVPLEANGDFRIDDTLLPMPPSPCVAAVLLIRNAANQTWFAAGIPKQVEHDD